MANVIGRIADGKLKTNARLRDIHGSWIGYMYETLRDHPVVVTIAFVSSVLGIITSIPWLVHLFRS